MGDCVHRLAVFTLLSLYVSGQVILVDQYYPVGIDGGNPLVSAPENAANVSMFCVVTADGLLLNSGWRIRKDGEPSFSLLSFKDNGEGLTDENLMTTPNSQLRQNLTILVFGSSLDNAIIQCGQGNTFPIAFDLRITCKSVNKIHHCNLASVNWISS